MGTIANTLIVDDDPLVRRGLRRIFAPGCIDAETVAEGVRLAEEHQPALIILDVKIGAVDGIEAIPLLLNAAPDAKIIIFTNLTTTADRKRARELGAVSYIDKMHISRIREIVDDILTSDLPVPVYRRATLH